MAGRRREGDPSEFDPAPLRSNETPEVGLSWGGKTIRARGLGAVIFLLVLALGAVQLYAGWRVEKAIGRVLDNGSAQHANLKKSQDRTSCIVAMSPTDREEFRRTYRTGAFEQWCPWLSE